MLKTILLVGAGGFFGSISRYLVSLLITEKVDVNFPLGTMTVNVLGCLLIGLLFGFFTKNLSMENWQLFAITGFLGGFTTFSSFSLETVMLIRNTDFLRAGIYVLGSLVLGFLATGIGFWLTYGGTEKV